MATTNKGIYYPTDYTKVADVPADMKALAESVDTAIENSKYDDTAIKQDISNIKQDISNIKSEQTTQNTNISANTTKNAEQDSLIQKLKDNMINLTTEEDTSLYITDAGTPPAKLTIRGNHRQEVKNSINELHLIDTPETALGNGLSYKIEDETLILNGSVSSAYGLVITTQSNIVDLIKSGEEWVLSVYGENMPDVNTFIRIATTSNANALQAVLTSSSLEDDSSATFTENSTAIRIMLAANAVYNNSKIKMKLEPGSTKTDYDKYCKMPSIETPSEISTVKDEVNVVVSNKNLMPILTEYWEYTEQGIKNKSRNAGVRLTEIKLKAGQTVKVGFKLITKPSVSTSFTASVNSIVNDSISFYNFNAFNINELYSKSYTATEDVVIRYVMYGNENSDIFEFQMWAELNALTDYVKHEEIKKTLDIQQEMLKEDYFVKEADGWKEVHLRSKRNIKEDIQNAEISGTKNFIFISNLLQDTYKKIPSNTYDTNTISNIASHSSYQDMYDKKIDYGIGISNVGSLIIRCKEFTTLEEYKTALNNDSYYYYYYLETPTKLACTKTQSQVLDQLFELDLFKGINNIYTEEGIALMQLDYSADTKQTVDSLNDRITALEQQLLNTAGSEG